MNEEKIESVSKRMSVKKSGDTLSIVISATSDSRKTRLMLLWLVVWTLSGGYVIYSYFQLGDGDQKAKIATLIWIAFWLYFEYMIARSWQWRRFGKEIVQVRDGKLHMKRDVQGRGFVYSYDAGDVSDFKKYTDKSPGWLKKLGDDFWNVDGDTIVFTAEKQSVKFGFQLSEQETAELLRLLKHYVKGNAKKKAED